MLSEDIQRILAVAGTCATKLGHDEITLTHIMFVLCDSGMDGVFSKLQMDKTKYTDDLIRELVRNTSGFEVTGTGDLRLTPAAGTCLADAEEFSAAEGRNVFTTEELFVQILSKDYGQDGDGYARRAFLRHKGVGEPHSHAEGLAPAERNVVGAHATSLAAVAGTSLLPEPGAHAAQHVARPPAAAIDASALTWCVDLVSLAENGGIDQVYGREAETKRICEILGRRRKNNPILIGEAGVGKTAAVEGLAYLIASGGAPSFLSHSRILALDVARLVSGTCNRGDLEARVTALLDAMKRDPRIILFIDEIHSLVSATNGMAGVADLMKPALASGSIRCIGATTFDEYSRYFANDPALVRRFQEVAVAEPSREQAIDIMRNVAVTYADHHQVSYSDEALVHAVDLSIRYLVNRHLPDKAIDILDEAGSLVRGSSQPAVTSSTIVEVVRKMTRDKFLENGDPAFWDEMARAYKATVVQHGEACSDIMTFLRRISGHPMAREGAKASFLLRGPEGVGKEFMAETLASLLEIPFLKLDMTTFSDSSSSSGLIGARPGYVGFDEGGKLTEFVKRQPLCVILFDKLDRAHQSARQIVEAALGSGSILDARGRKVSFRNVIGIVTNDDEHRAEPIGFFTQRDSDERVSGSSLQFDRTFSLQPVGKAAARQLVETRVARVVAGYASTGSRLVVPDDVIDEVTRGATAQGSRARDVDQAYSALFETELFRHHVSAGEAVYFKVGAGGRIVAVVERVNEQTAA